MAEWTGPWPEQAFCPCGSAWFVATTALTHDGEVNGIEGPLQCAECLEEFPVGWRGAINSDGSWFDPSEFA